MKIVFVTRETPFSKRCGGIGTYVWDMAKKLKQAGHNIIIIAASDDIHKKHEENIDGIRLIFLDGADFYLGKSGFLSLLYSTIRGYSNYRAYRNKIAITLESLINKGEADIVEFAEYGNEALVWKEKKRRIPMIIRLHTPGIFDRKSLSTISIWSNPLKYYLAKLELKTVNNADAVSSPSKSLTNFFIRTLNIKLKNYELIYNAIDYNSWSSPVTENNNEMFTIFSAGSVAKGKGYGELFEACKQLNKEGFNIKLEIAGKLGELGRNLKELKENDLSLHWFSLLGLVQREKLKEYYSGADLVCFPSWWENLPMVTIEAMASGALVLGSSNGGMSEIIDDGIDGFLVEPKNVQLLKEKIKEIISLLQEKKIDVRKKAQKKVKDKFDSKIIVHQQSEFYEKIIKLFKNESQ